MKKLIQLIPYIGFIYILYLAFVKDAYYSNSSVYGNTNFGGRAMDYQFILIFLTIILIIFI